MQIHQLTRTHANKKGQQVGRGGRRGKTSGRGMKGQKARAGRKLRPEMRDTIKKIPKRRGYGKHRGTSLNSGRKIVQGVNVSALEKAFAAGAAVTPAAILGKKLISARGGKMPIVKILGGGELTKKLSLSGVLVSASALQKIKKAGGTTA